MSKKTIKIVVIIMVIAMVGVGLLGALYPIYVSNKAPSPVKYNMDKKESEMAVREYMHNEKQKELEKTSNSNDTTVKDSLNPDDTVTNSNVSEKVEEQTDEKITEGNKEKIVEEKTEVSSSELIGEEGVLPIK